MSQPPQPLPPQRRQFLTGRPPEASTDSGPDNAVDLAPLFSFSANAMGCEFQILCVAAMQQALAQVIHPAFQLLEDLEQQMTIYRADSELSAINRTAAHQAVPVESGLFRLIVHALELSRQTDGAFDITATPVTRLWNFHRRDGQMPAAREIVKTLADIGNRHIQLDAESSSIRFANPALQLDLGAIGKGFALDRLADLLLHSGVSDFLIHGGQSSIVARGRRGSGTMPKSAPWTIGISHPLVPTRRLAELKLGNEAVGTSGCGRQSFVYQGTRYGHVIDPRTGWPADQHLSVTVVASEAMNADALATALFVMDARSVREFCREHPQIRALALSQAAGEPGRLSAQVYNLPGHRVTWYDPGIQVVTHWENRGGPE